MGAMKRLNVKRMLKEPKQDEYKARPAFTYKPRQAKTKSQGSQQRLFQEQSNEIQPYR